MVAWRDIYKTDKMKLFCDRAGRLKISILAELGRVQNKEFRIFLIQWIAEGMTAKEKFNVKEAAYILRDIRLKHNSIESFMETDSKNNEGINDNVKG